MSRNNTFHCLSCNEDFEVPGVPCTFCDTYDTEPSRDEIERLRAELAEEKENFRKHLAAKDAELAAQRHNFKIMGESLAMIAKDQLAAKDAEIARLKGDLDALMSRFGEENKRIAQSTRAMTNLLEKAEAIRDERDALKAALENLVHARWQEDSEAVADAYGEADNLLARLEAKGAK